MNAAAELGRVRKGLAALSAYYTLLLSLSLSLDGPVPGGPPPWVSAVALGAMAASNAGAAWALGPRRPSAWGWAVMSSAFSMVGCLPAPLGLYLVKVLFSPTIKSWCLLGKSPSERP